MSLHDFQRVQERLRSVADPVGFLVNLFAHAPVGFAVWTADGRPLLTNNAFMELFHSEPPEGYNVLEDELLAANGMLELFRRAFRGETVHVPTFWYDPRELTSLTVTEGRRVAISMTIFPLFASSGAIEYVAATYKDETEVSRLTEELERRVHERTLELRIANRELEAFSYSVAHDLRAPLRGMNGFANILLDEYADRLDADGLDCLRRIQGGAVLMGQMIDALLMLSGVTRRELRRERVDLSAMARDIVHQLAVAEPGRTVAVEIDEGMSAFLDPALARTLYENLIGNAWKFTGAAAEARIQIGCARHEGATEYFVRDNGAGFDAAHAEKLFAPFQRLHGPREFPGTGIGLATAHRIVTRHGGRLWGEGRIGEGAAFHFELPSP